MHKDRDYRNALIKHGRSNNIGWLLQTFVSCIIVTSLNRCHFSVIYTLFVWNLKVSEVVYIYIIIISPIRTNMNTLDRLMIDVNNVY